MKRYSVALIALAILMLSTAGTEAATSGGGISVQSGVILQLDSGATFAFATNYPATYPSCYVGVTTNCTELQTTTTANNGGNTGGNSGPSGSSGGAPSPGVIPPSVSSVTSQPNFLGLGIIAILGLMVGLVFISRIEKEEKIGSGVKPARKGKGIGGGLHRRSKKKLGS